MLKVVTAAALLLAAAPAMAQNWTSYQSGNQRNYTGYDQNGGMWTGSTYQSGNQTNSTFYGPNGQMTTCTSVPMGNQVNTNCH